jgi:antagonist of KipI
MGIKVLKAGLLSSIQDLGRSGFQRYGMTVCGAMDTWALRLGNILLGNEEGEAAIECTQLGPTLRFDEGQLICITGGDLSPRIDGLPVALWKPIFVPEGGVLSFGKPLSGCRSYICFYGGLDIAEVMGSRSTYIKGGIGGWKGRALAKEDRIGFRSPYIGAETKFGWRIAPSLYSTAASRIIRVTTGPQFEDFDSYALVEFLSGTFTLSQASDRMGYRLKSKPLQLKEQGELLSTAVTFGTIQVPPQGNAIVLMADHPTTGGYPVIGQVATIDLPLLAQMEPEEQLEFDLITLTEAQELLRLQSKQLKQLKRAIAFKYDR